MLGGFGQAISQGIVTALREIRLTAVNHSPFLLTAI
jgi:hypothetical protein